MRLPHKPGGLLAQSSQAALGNRSNPVVNAYEFTADEREQPASIEGISQSTGASVSITGSGQVTQVNGSPTFGSTVTVSGKALSQPSGKNITQVDVSIPAPSEVPSFTLITETRPPTDLTCPTVPTPVSVECPPGFEPTSGPALVTTEPGGCGGDNRYWYRALAPSAPVLPTGAAEIQRLTYDGFNYLLAQSDGEMPTSIGCAWKYGGVTAFGCREILPDFSSGGRLDPLNGPIIATASGGCGGPGSEWYLNVDSCPLGSRLMDDVDFQNNNYKLCASEAPLPPGIGCGWKFGAQVTDCSFFEGCYFGLDYTIDTSTSWATSVISEATEREFIDVSVSFSGNSADRHTMGILSYPCAPSRSGLQSITFRIEDVHVLSNGPIGIDTYLYLYAKQGVHDYFYQLPFNIRELVQSFVGGTSGGYEVVYNGTVTVGANNFARFNGRNLSGATLSINDLDFAQPLTLGFAWGTYDDDYFLSHPPVFGINFVANTCQASFNY